MSIPKASTAATRWRDLVRARLSEKERLFIERDAIGPGFGDPRPGHGIMVTSPPWWFASGRPLEEARNDPFLRRILRVVGQTAYILDVGAGTGRFTLQLAPSVRQVTAVDENEENLSILRHQARKLGLSNVRTVLGRWEDAAVEPASVAFSSHVLPLVEDAPRFLTKLGAASQGQAFLYMGAFYADAVFDPLWRHFHGASRSPGPTYLDAVAVLREIGVAPMVEVVEVRDRTRFATLADATKEFGDYLVLPKTRKVTQELAGLLASWLVKSHGALRPPLRTLPAAVIRWGW